jgi:transcriptional regulator with XRE-family HTH domain
MTSSILGLIMDKVNLKIGEVVKARREEMGLSQEGLADKLDLQRPAISQIESGQRKVSADELVKLSKTLNLSMGHLVGLEQEPHVTLEKAGPSSQTTEEPGIRINVPQKNLAKFREVLLYILSRVGSKPNIGETALYKLLYFIDFDFYEQYEEQMIGATYIRNNYGPTPVEFKKIVDRMIDSKEMEKVKSQYFAFPQTKYLPLRSPDLSKLNARELEVIDKVLDKLSDKNASQLSEYSHRDVPWMTAKEGGKIEYESVFYRTPEYSVRQYGDDIS